MPTSESAVTFIIVAFVFALILILKKDTIPPKMKRTLAIFALLFVASAFALLVYMLFNAGQAA